ncbi:hypothetical protein CHS0354_035120 [Potamilus streckersoni]|uniref:CCDC113/CCDC96 coiled-coil domain-containing protein n=1 Tax=Potamilus streckersoni TaxID=2493646 RepID=A0AAE0WAH4_9BIVA|nr:hypothetical protein CHS0354_035120 [Potamilus streckersoni]
MADEESAPIEPVEEEKPAEEEAAPAQEDQVPTEEEAIPAPEAEEQVPAGEDLAPDDANNNAVEETEKVTEEAQMEGEQATEGVASETGGGNDEQATEVAEGEGEAKPEGEAEAIGEGQAEEEAAEEKKASGGDGKTGEEGDIKEDEEEQVAEEEAGEDGDGEAKPEGEDEETTLGEEQDEVSKSPIPKSDTFAEGDRAESPTVGVGEKLSREASPIQEERELGKPDILEPGTPERSRPGSVTGEGEEDEEGRQLDTFEEEDEEEEEEEEKPQFDREELMERYHQAIAEREQLQQQNYQLQHKLAEYFRKKKADDSRQEYDKNVTDQEQRYLKYMAQLEDLRRQDLQQRDGYKDQIEDLKKKCEERKERVDKEKQTFMEFKKQVAFNSINSRSGKPIPPKDIEQYLSAENKKEAEVVNVRLENIKLKNKLRKKEQQLKSKEELAEGLHLIDFEQLKIENQTYNEKIEERNEELLKLRKKITSTVQVLTHLKEKLQYVQRENQIQKERLREVEAEAGHKRDVLSRTKQARDALRIDNQRLRQSSGLLGNEPLLRDFEEQKDEGDELRHKLEQLKRDHAELTLNCSQVRRKIEQTRNGRS